MRKQQFDQIDTLPRFAMELLLEREKIFFPLGMGEVELRRFLRLKVQEGIVRTGEIEEVAQCVCEVCCGRGTIRVQGDPNHRYFCPACDGRRIKSRFQQDITTARCPTCPHAIFDDDEMRDLVKCRLDQTIHSYHSARDYCPLPRES